MVTPNRFTVILGGVLVSYAWSLHAANQKLTAAALARAEQRGSFPVSGQVISPLGIEVSNRHFSSFFDESGVLHGE
jgi:hypothetical protein